MKNKLNNDKFSVLRIILIIFFSFIPNIGLNSIFYAILITMILHSSVIIYVVFKYTKYKLNIKNLVKILLITIITINMNYIINFLNLNYLINSSLIIIIFLGLCYCFNLININFIKN